jgi:hypothetical protein
LIKKKRIEENKVPPTDYRMKLVIIDLQLDAFKRTPVSAIVAIFNPLGAEQLRVSLPISMFSHARLEVGQEVVLTPKIKEISSL